MKTISAANANRQFSKILREVSHGEAYTVTSRGKVVASIQSATQNEKMKKATRGRLLERLQKVKSIEIPPWNREELYED